MISGTASSAAGASLLQMQQLADLIGREIHQLALELRPTALDDLGLNTALVNAVGSHIRVTAIAVNIFLFHLFGDVPSPAMMGYVADHHSLQAAFILPVIAMAVSSAILFYGMRFAPPLRLSENWSAPAMGEPS